jgi:hypothetical protein
MNECPRCGDDTRARTCYVDVAKSVQSVYAAWTRGAYPLLSPTQGARMLTGRPVRPPRPSRAPLPAEPAPF